MFYTCNIHDWHNVIHQKTTKIKYNKTPSKGMSLVVVAHHSIAAGGGCPLFVLACWVPLLGAGAIRCPCEGSDPDLCVVHRCCLLDWPSVLVWCHSLLLASRCWVVCHGYGAGAICLIPGLVLIIIPVCHCHPIPYPCCLSFPIAVPHYPFPVGCCPAVYPVSRGSQRWHKAGRSLPYNIFKT